MKQKQRHNEIEPNQEGVSFADISISRRSRAAVVAEVIRMYVRRRALACAASGLALCKLVMVGSVRPALDIRA